MFLFAAAILLVPMARTASLLSPGAGTGLQAPLWIPTSDDGLVPALDCPPNYLRVNPGQADNTANATATPCRAGLPHAEKFKSNDLQYCKSCDTDADCRVGDKCANLIKAFGVQSCLLAEIADGLDIK
ncbi:hypothetical protein C8R46DRAFT_1027447 [Mycena filopes]|nr:hypothetical protein C8R46DRAFT_1027447 [Mycena filopes]